MSKKDLLELQKLDCNCNDCEFMVRDMQRFKASLGAHLKWQQDYFNTMKQNLLSKANTWSERGEHTKAESLRKEAGKMRFQFDKKGIAINYGECTWFKWSVSFIPNTLQLDTQRCFSHRRDA